MAAQVQRDLHGDDLVGDDGPLVKMGQGLATLYRQYQRHLDTRAPEPFESSDPLVRVANERVLIDAVAHDSDKLLVALQQLGLEQGAMFKHMVSGWLPIATIPQAAALGSLRFARPAAALTNVGLVTSQGDVAQRSNLARANFNVDGTGIKVGTLSDSFNCRVAPLTDYPTDVTNGDLPAGIVPLADLSAVPSSSCSDEGRGMMQLIADVAPGSAQQFHTAFNGIADFAQGILDLAADGADVIVDDVIYFAEPMFQDGVIAQSADQVAALGIPYFSSAGNSARQSYESLFRASASVLTFPQAAGVPHDFDPGPGDDPFQLVTIPNGTTNISLQWDQPYASASGGAGATSDLVFCLYDSTPLVTEAPFFCVDSANIGNDPVESFFITNSGSAAAASFAVIRKSGGNPGRLKYVYFRSGMTVNEYATNSPTIYGHANAAGARAVGAAPYWLTPPYGTTPPVKEAFSSAGPTPILFDLTDTPVLDERMKPEFVAPDGGNTSFFGSDITDPGDGSDLDTFPNFFGTSAAAPHAAAVAALMLQQADLTPAGVYDVLASSGIDMLTPGFDDDTGYGLIDAQLVMASTAPVFGGCGVLDLWLTDTPNTGPQIFRACNSITAGPGQFDDVILVAGNIVGGTVSLLPGFNSAGSLSIITQVP